MLLVKNAKVYAPEYLGVKDILIAGGRIERIADHLPEFFCFGVRCGPQ